MNIPAELSANTNALLENLSFRLTHSEDNGMLKGYIWKNNIVEFKLFYDRCFYEAFLVALKKPFERIPIISLLRFLKNDKKFYVKELTEANLSNTLTVNEYIKLLHNNYDIISNFLKSYGQENYDLFIKY